MLFRDISPVFPHFVSRGSRRARRIGASLRLFVGSRMILIPMQVQLARECWNREERESWLDLPNSREVAADVQPETRDTKAYMKGSDCVYKIYITFSETGGKQLRFYGLSLRFLSKYPNTMNCPQFVVQTNVGFSTQGYDSVHWSIADFGGPCAIAPPPPRTF
jgi:hypothetical protein